jgi:hypothetical protein
VAWLLPATALSVSTVAAGVRWSTTNAALTLLAGWFGALAVGEFGDGRHAGPPLAEAPVFGVPGQLVALSILVVSVVVVYSHRHSVFQEVIR